MTPDEIVSDIINEVLAYEANLTCHFISGSGIGWFLDPDLKAMVMINRGTEVVPVETLENNRSLVRSPYNFLIIPDDELIEIGYN
jgi:hypothetical protein